MLHIFGKGGVWDGSVVGTTVNKNVRTNIHQQLLATIGKQTFVIRHNTYKYFGVNRVTVWKKSKVNRQLKFGSNYFDRKTTLGFLNA